MSLSGWIAGLSALVLMGGSAEAGSLEPPGPPAPTMKTLDEIPPTWSQALPANDGAESCNSSRFKCVLPTATWPTGGAVLDRETGLVWDRFPGTQSHYFNNVCLTRRTGERMGWHMPTLTEVTSLLDPTQPAGTSPMLPPGHPFAQVQAGLYWTSTRGLDLGAALRMYAVNLGTSAVTSFDLLVDSPALYIWCVRGGAEPEIQ